MTFFAKRKSHNDFDNQAGNIRQALANKSKDSKIVVAFSDIGAYEKFSRVFPKLGLYWQNYKNLLL